MVEFFSRQLSSNKTAALHKPATALSVITDKCLLKCDGRMWFATASEECAAFSDANRCEIKSSDPAKDLGKILTPAN